MLNKVRSALVRWLVPEFRQHVTINVSGVTPERLTAIIERNNAEFARRLPSLVKAAERREI
jgi:hypothetical protein